ncbi:hypothetical protein GOP47_0009753 [Adiantum capillus-veneris]|uniref:Uncharacterized protein n=1 Tax=Adiantum capillus-veneris TaxID=13818 RepID=A0A9D4UXP9_ADICA|nr:hypothetical protein GOP47_0009753 [Adiantum capillus-veneris]
MFGSWSIESGGTNCGVNSSQPLCLQREIILKRANDPKAKLSKEMMAPSSTKVEELVAPSSTKVEELASTKVEAG